MKEAREQAEMPGISFGSMVSLNAILLLALGFQISVFYATNKKEEILPVALSSMGSAALLAAAAWVAKRAQADFRNHILACIFTLFLGPAGCLISMVCCSANYLLSRSIKKNFSEWLFNYLYASNAREKRSDALYQRIIAGQESAPDAVDTEPLSDIMESGSQEQKQQALINAVKYFNPSMAPILKAGLRDKSNLIRVQAAGGIAKLQDLFHKRYSAYAERMRSGLESPEDLIEFAELCGSFASAGLLDADKREEAIESSVAIYRRCIERNPANAELKMSLAKMLMTGNDIAGALEVLGEALPKLGDAPSKASIDTASELLFKAKRFGELRAFAARLKEKAPKKLELWTGEAGEETPRRSEA